MEEPVPWTLTAAQFVENRLLSEMDALPPSNTKAAFARVPETDIAVPETVAVEPASCTERPLPRCPVALTVLFVSRRVPPDRTRVADEGSLSAWEVLLVLMVALVSATTPPFSARAALANRPEVPSVTFVASIRLPDPVATRAWLPVGGVVPAFPGSDRDRQAGGADVASETIGNHAPLARPCLRRDDGAAAEFHRSSGQRLRADESPRNDTGTELHDDTLRCDDCPGISGVKPRYGGLGYRDAGAGSHGAGGSVDQHGSGRAGLRRRTADA
ncbi:hypothetical protein GR248_24395 [Rhizobium leguminosarum]|uniref:hypothetical protein n=1 Tax=Rhizobium leguminosarum TaxID=384 RepID=UPI0013CA71EA|nr:hypothetical protein [Rhizobium leguminosarum]NEI93940.1 hypothetical protein [Rhizobium leguminosarum]